MGYWLWVLPYIKQTRIAYAESEEPQMQGNYIIHKTASIEHLLTFADFKNHVRAFIKKAGGEIAVNFFYDKNKGRYYANCSDGVTIIGNPSSLKIRVTWGSRHNGVANL